MSVYLTRSKEQKQVRLSAKGQAALYIHVSPPTLPPATYRVILQLLSNKERCASEQLDHVHVGQSGRTVHRSVGCSSLSDSFDIIGPQLSPGYRPWCPVVMMSSGVYALGMNLREALPALPSYINMSTHNNNNKKQTKEDKKN